MAFAQKQEEDAVRWMTLEEQEQVYLLARKAKMSGENTPAPTTNRQRLAKLLETDTVV